MTLPEILDAQYQYETYSVTLAVVREPAITHPPTLDRPDEVYKAFRALCNCDQEHVAVAYLDGKYKMIGIHTAHVGDRASSPAAIPDLFKAAILHSAAAIVLVHNHPSGQSSPSPEDITLTRRVQDVGKLLDIHLLDHIIITHNGYTSLRETGYIE